MSKWNEFLVEWKETLDLLKKDLNSLNQRNELHTEQIESASIDYAGIKYEPMSESDAKKFFWKLELILFCVFAVFGWTTFGLTRDYLIYASIVFMLPMSIYNYCLYRMTLSENKSR